MDLTALVLTDQPPVHDAQSGNVALGNAVDGNFRVQGPGPYTIALGVYMEIEARPDEEGVFEVALYAEPVTIQGVAHGKGLLRAWSRPVNPAGERWTSRRVYFETFEAEFYVAEECVLDLIVEIDGSYAGERTIRLRRLDIPPTLPSGV